MEIVEEQQPGEDEQIAPDVALLAAIGYLPVLFFLPLMLGQRDSYTRFHGRQSMVLFFVFVGIWAAIWLVDMVFGRMLGNVILLGFIFRGVDWIVHNVVGSIVSLAYIVVMVVCIAQAATGHRWRIPFLSVYADRFAGSTQAF